VGALSGIPSDKPVHQITRGERLQLGVLLKDLVLHIRARVRSTRPS
jgi:hypothetical protein